MAINAISKRPVLSENKVLKTFFTGSLPFYTVLSIQIEWEKK